MEWSACGRSAYSKADDAHDVSCHSRRRHLLRLHVCPPAPSYTQKNVGDWNHSANQGLYVHPRQLPAVRVDQLGQELQVVAGELVSGRGRDGLLEVVIVQTWRARKQWRLSFLRDVGGGEALPIMGLATEQKTWRTNLPHHIVTAWHARK